MPYLLAPFSHGWWQWQPSPSAQLSIPEPGPNPARCLGSWWWVHSCAATPFTASSAVPCCQLLQSDGCPVHPLWWRLSCKTSWGQCNVPFPWAVITCGVMFRLRKRSLRPAGLARPHCWGGLPHAHTTQAVGWGLSSQDPSALLQTPLAVTAAPCCVLELHPSQKYKHPRTDLRS